jgi:HTH-type transcriptional regulator, cell division transcriptional repressor
MTTEPKQNLSSPKARGKRLHYIRKELLRLSRHALQERHKDLKISERSIENWETARFKGLKEEHVERLLRAFKREGVICEKYWLLDGEGSPPIFEGAFRQISTSTDTKESHEASEITKITQELRSFKASYIDAVDAIVQDDGLAPCFRPGEWVAGIRHIGDDIKNVAGSLCIVQTQEGATLIRKVEKGEKEGLFNLTATNPNFKDNMPSQENIELLSAAPIIWWRKPLKT